MNRNPIALVTAASLLSLAALAWTAHSSDGPEQDACCIISANAAISAKPMLTLDGANLVLAAAIAEARQRAAGGAIAVVDDGGNLIALQRLDGTFAAGAEVSIGKARSAALFKKPTRAFEESISKGRAALLGVSVLTPLQGGVPIEYEGAVIGAIGVSGAHSQAEDEDIALAGAAAIATTQARQ